mgnify:CR=1 FL=1
MEIGKIVASNLKRLREEQNLSQGQLAEKACVSKVVISQIEKGDANPTINTIWKLTGALNLPYTSLLEPPNLQAVHIRKKDITALTEDQYHIFSYYPKSAERNFELYEIEMDAGCKHSSIGHSSNSFEYILVTEGEFSLRVGEQNYHLATEDALYFDASLPHCYTNSNAQTAKAVLLIQYL